LCPRNSEVETLYASVAAHEAGHLLGLVEPGAVLDGTNDWHNKSPAGVNVMDSAEGMDREQLGGSGQGRLGGMMALGSYGGIWST